MNNKLLWRCDVRQMRTAAGSSRFTVVQFSAVLAGGGYAAQQGGWEEGDQATNSVGCEAKQGVGVCGCVYVHGRGCARGVARDRAAPTRIVWDASTVRPSVLLRRRHISRTCPLPAANSPRPSPTVFRHGAGGAPAHHWASCTWPRQRCPCAASWWSPPVQRRPEPQARGEQQLPSWCLEEMLCAVSFPFASRLAAISTSPLICCQYNGTSQIVKKITNLSHLGALEQRGGGFVEVRPEIRLVKGVHTRKVTVVLRNIPKRHRSDH